jgi:SAM-dependent methyltransferase
MNKMGEWWNKKHHKYATEDWIDKPTIFSQWAIQYFPKEGIILDIAAGHGQDDIYFARQGYDVVSTDFSETALDYNTKKIPPELKDKIVVKKLDLSDNLPFGSNHFDVVYGHLAVHYFNDETTDKVFSEIKRVLKPGGILALLVNSTQDPEYGNGEKLGTDYFELSEGDVKHFFSIEYMSLKTKYFKEIVLDSKGTTYKDNAKGVFNLIRYIGQKI